MKKLFFLSSVVAVFEMISASNLQAADLLCQYEDVSYRTVAAPHQTDNWMMVGWVKVKCEGHDEVGYIRPFVKPVSLNFEVAPGETVAIQNNDFNFNHLLIGEHFPLGKEANEFINNSIKKTHPHPVRTSLISFTIDESETIYTDEKLTKAFPNLHTKDMRAIYEAKSQALIEALEKKYKLPADSSRIDIELAGMDQFLTKFSGEVSLNFQNDCLSVEPKAYPSVSYFYRELVPIMLNHWKITEEQARDGIIIKLEKGQRAR